MPGEGMNGDGSIFKSSSPHPDINPFDKKKETCRWGQVSFFVCFWPLLIVTRQTAVSNLNEIFA